MEKLQQWIQINFLYRAQSIVVKAFKNVIQTGSSS